MNERATMIFIRKGLQPRPTTAPHLLLLPTQNPATIKEFLSTLHILETVKTQVGDRHVAMIITGRYPETTRIKESTENRKIGATTPTDGQDYGTDGVCEAAELTLGGAASKVTEPVGVI